MTVLCLRYQFSAINPSPVNALDRTDVIAEFWHPAGVYRAVDIEDYSISLAILKFPQG